MPTEHHYRTAADDLRLRARAYRDTVAWSPRRVADGFTGDGPVGEAVTDGYRRTLVALEGAADRFEAAAAECERRADVCRDHRRALDRWWALPDQIRAVTSAPARPASWVDA